jgi:two-component system, LytTR family, sensor kinase
MKVKLPQYSGKDYLVLGLIILPVTVILNMVIFGTGYFRGFNFFWQATLITTFLFCIQFILCSSIAVLFKNRFPDENDLGIKLTLMIITFILLTGLFLLLLFRGYEIIGFYDYTFNEKGFTWSYISMAIVNIFITFIMEGIASFNKWQKNILETEELRKTFKQTELNALKSQVNPHFLFNSLNSLSSLLAEDNDKAENFLDEMSKVYRYMLRNDDDQLVTLETELKFIESYLHLLNTRFGGGLTVTVAVDEEDKQKLLAPLTLQVIIEDAFTHNAFSKTNPLTISVTTRKKDSCIVVKNNIRPKKVTRHLETETGLDNLVAKYHLLGNNAVDISDNESERIICVPLINKKEEVPL